jgi:opacity protein-like surface antigen
MDNRLIFLCSVFLLLKTSLFAQTAIGVEGGLSNNSYHTNIDNRAATNLTSLTGVSVNLSFRYKVKSWLYITTAPGVVQKGYSMNRTDSLFGEYDRHNNTYLQLPVGISLTYDWRRFRATLDPGIYGGYWLAGRVKGTIANVFSVADNTNSSGQTTEQFQLSNYDERYSFLSRRDQRWEFGWVVGAGLQYHLSGKYWLTAAAKYYQSLTSQEKAAVSIIPAYNRTWTFSIGGLWSLAN